MPDAIRVHDEGEILSFTMKINQVDQLTVVFMRGALV